MFVKKDFVSTKSETNFYKFSIKHYSNTSDIVKFEISETSDIMKFEKPDKIYYFYFYFKLEPIKKIFKLIKTKESDISLFSLICLESKKSIFFTINHLNFLLIFQKNEVIYHLKITFKDFQKLLDFILFL